MQNVLPLGTEVPGFNVGDAWSSIAFFATGLLRALIQFVGQNHELTGHLQGLASHGPVTGAPQPW